jgi:hypothetical protein
MFKFGPLVSLVYALAFCGQYQVNLHKQILEDIKNDNFNNMDFMHHISSGFKATFTKLTYEGMDVARQACGGAGFSTYSGIPSKL